MFSFDKPKGLEDPSQFRRRAFLAIIFVFLCLCILLLRLAYLQLVKAADYQAAAYSNRTVSVPIAPQRGLIFDRNGTILAQNYWANSLEVFPTRIQGKRIDDLINDLSEIMAISPGDRRRYLRLREESRSYESIPLRTNLTDEEAARFIANRWRFPGLEIVPQQHRLYPMKGTASHVLGYISRISQRDLSRIEKNGTSAQYEGLHSIGKLGIEASYEDDLRGTPGKETLEVRASGRPVRTLGVTAPEPGKNLELSIDINLQKVAEAAFNGEAGAAIVIEPVTGEILAFVSSPTYDLNVFPDGIDPDTWDELSNDPGKPLMNRAIRGLYPIGSTYKPFMALAGQHYGIINAQTTINDTAVFIYHDHRFRDASGIAKGMMNLRRSIITSSDVYYYWLASQLGVDRIHDFMQQWGFGQKTGIDMLGEQTGVLPSREWKKKRFKQNWFPGDTINLGIGQGYNQFTLLQLAHAVATLANRGVIMTPHLVRRVYDPFSGAQRFPFNEPTGVVNSKPQEMENVIEAMGEVTKTGTARKAFANATYHAAGKTGTAQVITIAQDKKYDASKISREHHDHGLFIGFAPIDKPRIAVAILKENGGFGAQAAAPIARSIMDYWLEGTNSLGLPPPKHLAATSSQTLLADKKTAQAQ